MTAATVVAAAEAAAESGIQIIQTTVAGVTLLMTFTVMGMKHILTHTMIQVLIWQMMILELILTVQIHGLNRRNLIWQ